MTIFDEIQGTIARLAESAGSSVTGIGQRWGVGSGIVLGEGRVLTNAHNVRGSQATVTLAGGRTAEGTVAGHDFDGDLAVIEADTGQAAALPWATAAPAIGTPVFALANPGGRGLRVTFGTVSGIDRSFRGPRGLRITGNLEHTAPLLPGSSGGPVLDAAGQLLGINTNRLGEGFYLAIPADETLRERVDALARGESVRPPQLGIAITPGHLAKKMRRAVGLPDAEGLLVRDVAEDSPAARAGLARGDLIVTAAGQPIRSADDLADALRAAAGTIELTILRGTDERSIQVGFDPDSQPGGAALSAASDRSLSPCRAAKAPKLACCSAVAPLGRIEPLREAPARGFHVAQVVQVGCHHAGPPGAAVWPSSTGKDGLPRRGQPAPHAAAPWRAEP